LESDRKEEKKKWFEVANGQAGYGALIQRGGRKKGRTKEKTGE
jgi:hypothetical protein